MSRQPDYTFKIENFTPESMPFGRLVQYYSELGKMLGMYNGIHLTSITQGSQLNGFTVDPEFQSVLASNIQNLKTGKGPKRARNALENIDLMLSEDGTCGQFLGKDQEEIIRFDGVKTDEDALFEIEDNADFKGYLYNIIGQDNRLSARVKTHAFGMVACSARLELGRELRHFFDEDVHIIGRGRWLRSPNGKWRLKDVEISDFKPVKPINLTETVNIIKGLDIDWPEDPIAEMELFDEKLGAVH